jgi:hypothetical protein
VNHQELDQLRETARQLSEENIRLKGTLTMMRNEMEVLLLQQQQQQADTGGLISGLRISAKGRK